jgi:hypothetical protein
VLFNKAKKRIALRQQPSASSTYVYQSATRLATFQSTSQCVSLSYVPEERVREQKDLIGFLNSL